MKRTPAYLLTVALTLAHSTALAHGKEEHSDKPKATPKAAATPAAVEAGDASVGSATTIEIAGHLAKLETAGNMLTLTITEKDGAPPESATDATLVIQAGAEKKTIALEGTGGKFTGKADLGAYAKFVAVLQLKLDGKSRSGRFTVERAAVKTEAGEKPAEQHGEHGEHEHNH